MTKIPDPKLYELMTSRVVDYAIFLLDPQGHIMSWNAGAALIKRYSADEIIGKHFSIFYTPADIARNWPATELQRAKTEGRFEDTGWRVRKDGSRFWANVVLTALRDDNGTLLAFSKITRDLTQRREEEESLRQSEERFRLLVDGVQDYAIYLLSPDGVVTSWNAGARRIKGYESSEIIGKHFSKFYAQEDIERGKPWTELAIARETGRAEDEGWRMRKDGSTFWARVVVTALHDSEGRMRGFAKVTQDLTQRRQSEALETASTNLTDFIAVLAHELRNPLAPIRNAIQLQRLAVPGDPVHEVSRNIIDRQSGHLSRMVDDLLDVSRITRGTLEIDAQPASVAAIVERAVETSRPAIIEAGHTLEIDLGAAPAPGILGDELRLAQALTNLLNNASRYTEPGGRITLKVSSANNGASPAVAISVRDNGRGIEPAFLHSIFGMFVQGRNMMNRPAAGLGVGLALARSIVELHHGTLAVASEGAGKGAQFTITLPALAGEAAAARVPVAAPPAETSAARKYRILVVDDNVDASAMLSSLLRLHGHEVLTINEGGGAISAFEGFRPEIVLLDLGMPGMDGLEVARRLRQRNRSPRPLIVAVTGWAQPEYEIRSREAGFDAHLVKPVEEPALLHVLETHSRSLH